MEVVIVRCTVLDNAVAQPIVFTIELAGRYDTILGRSRGQRNVILGI